MKIFSLIDYIDCNLIKNPVALFSEHRVFSCGARYERKTGRYSIILEQGELQFTVTCKNIRARVTIEPNGWI